MLAKTDWLTSDNAVAVAAVAVVLVYMWQNRRLSRGQRAQNLFAMFEALQSDEARENRRALINNALPPEQLNQPQHDAARVVVESAVGIVQRASVMMRHRLLPRRRVFIRNWGDNVILTWEASKDWIRFRRENNLGPPYLFDDFEWMARRCRKWKRSWFRVYRIARARSHGATPSWDDYTYAIGEQRERRRTIVVDEFHGNVDGWM